jgi:multidrug efflux system outer membrane protein
VICWRQFAAAVPLLPLCACTVGPNYKRPSLDVPGHYRGLPPDSSNQATGEPFAQLQWSAVFQDDALQALIKEALSNNYDVRIAAARVLQAGAILGITRANQFPSVDATGALGNTRTQPSPGNSTAGAAFIQASWILDFWGQYRRATEAARANLLASEYGQKAVRVTLVAGVANAYFQLRQFDFQLDISNQTVDADRDMVRLNTIKFEGGDAAKTDQLQAEVLLQQAEAQAITLKQSIEQTENAISILVGRNPGPIVRGRSLTEQPHAPDVPTGMPSAILEQRPDVRQAEESLIAANANVGIAKAAFFPQISLTGAFGVQSASLRSFLAGPTTAAWTAAGQAAQPIFEGGRINSNYRLAWAQRDESELVYQQTVQQAFGDVSNALVGYTQSRLLREKLQQQTATYQETAHLATVRFEGGYTSFLEVLVTQQNYFASQLILAQAWYSEMNGYVQLYQALGGGW